VVEVPFESAKRRLTRLAALAGVGLALLVAAVPAQAARPTGHGGNSHGHKVA
jgi:hypothetical protein